MGCEKKLYAIREVAERTGVKPVTLRAWQRRYNLVQPQRTDKGHRLYTDQHIELISEIQSWLSKGVPIGKVKDIINAQDTKSQSDSFITYQLDEVDTFLQALSELNKAKAESVAMNVFKEYPMDVVERQFIRPVEKAVSLVRYGLRSIQKGLMESILSARLNTIIDADNKAAREGKCLFINCDSLNDIQSRLWAIELSSLGMRMVIVDGVDDLSGLIEHSGLEPYKALALFSSRPLSQSQSNLISKIEKSFNGSVLLSDFIKNEAVI